mmetsp:Transcript_129858/g.277214  ORF Transcript_129858/g.277214 Transcript_129858/m.277214 type:complete len:692 (-) Transcript_129858:277-2352(-)
MGLLKAMHARRQCAGGNAQEAAQEEPHLASQEVYTLEDDGIDCELSRPGSPAEGGTLVIEDYVMLDSVWLQESPSSSPRSRKSRTLLSRCSSVESLGSGTMSPAPEAPAEEVAQREVASEGVGLGAAIWPRRSFGFPPHLATLPIGSTAMNDQMMAICTSRLCARPYGHSGPHIDESGFELPMETLNAQRASVIPMPIGDFDSDSEQGDYDSDAEQAEQDTLEEALGELIHGSRKAARLQNAARRRRRLAALNAFLSTAMPDWTRKDLQSVSEKLAVVQVRTVNGLLRALHGKGEDSLNVALKLAGEKSFTKDTMRRLQEQAKFLERMRALEAAAAAIVEAAPSPQEGVYDMAQKEQDELDESIRKLNEARSKVLESESEEEDEEERVAMLWRKLGPGSRRGSKAETEQRLPLEPEPEPHRKLSEGEGSLQQDSAEENPQEGSEQAKEDLTAVLRAARPDWKKMELRSARRKLAKIDISSVRELALMLRNFGGAHLNARLKAANELAFGSDTIIALRLYAEAQEAQASNAGAVPAPLKEAVAAVKVDKSVEVATPSQEDQSYFLLVSGNRRFQDLGIGERATLRLSQTRNCCLLLHLQAETPAGSPLKFILVAAGDKAAGEPGKHSLGMLCEVEQISTRVGGTFRVKIFAKASVRLQRTWPVPIPGLPWSPPLFRGTATVTPQATIRQSDA